jgi:peptidoglycan hydrolase-like protein with peptidoglycan-binding domain
MNIDPDRRIATAFTGPVLYPWDAGSAVAELQELLQAHGFPLRIDGDFGSVTETAVRLYQKRHKLIVDGVVGPKTWFSLKMNVKPGDRPLEQGDSGTDVLELQGLLQVHGHPVERNGIFDEFTQQAVVAFQQKHHLKACGIVNASTWGVLGEKRHSSPASKQKLWFSNPRKWW